MQAYERLERRWAEFNEVDSAGMVACSSGTAALHLALESLELNDKSQTLLPNFTMAACARAVQLATLTPRLVDCGDDLLMGQQWVDAIDASTESVMFVHVYGRVCLFPKMWNSYSPSLSVVEDLAEAHGVRPAPGTDAACWSFYKNKIVCGEEGGAVWFRDPERAVVARELRSLGFGPSQDYRHRPRGHNYRLANLLAEPILDSIDRYKDNVDSRWNQWELYRKQRWTDRVRQRPRPTAPWVFDLWIPGMNYVQQDELVKALRDEGISARHAFKPMSEQEEFKRCRVYGDGRAARMSKETIIFHLHTPDLPWRAREVVNRVVDSWRMPYRDEAAG